MRPSLGLRPTLEELENAQPVRGDFVRAASLSEAFVAKRRRLNLPTGVPAVLQMNARAQLAQDNLDLAECALAEARQLAEAQGARWGLRRILATMSQVETRRGETAQAQSLRAQAREHLDFIIARTPQEFRASFLNSPNVRNVPETQ